MPCACSDGAAPSGPWHAYRYVVSAGCSHQSLSPQAGFTLVVHICDARTSISAWQTVCVPWWCNLQAGCAFVPHICDAMHFHRCMAECVRLGGTNYRQAAPLWRLFVDGTCVLLMHDRPCVCPGGTIFTQARQARQAAPSYVVFSSCMHFHWCMAECGCPCGTIYDFCLL